MGLMHIKDIPGRLVPKSDPGSFFVDKLIAQALKKGYKFPESQIPLQRFRQEFLKQLFSFRHSPALQIPSQPIDIIFRYHYQVFSAIKSPIDEVMQNALST
jgi:hypothetical protein